MKNPAIKSHNARKHRCNQNGKKIEITEYNLKLVSIDRSYISFNLLLPHCIILIQLNLLQFKVICLRSCQIEIVTQDKPFYP